MQLILISGLAGSGKSIALNVLEDCGYYCVDNLPANLLLEAALNFKKSAHPKIAVSIDARSRKTLHLLPKQLAELKHQNVDVRLLFLEAKTDTLVKRFSETRRRHPLGDDHLTLLECIHLEREILAEIKDLTHCIDTSDLSASSLRTWVKDFMSLDQSRLTLLFQSFGFKHGIPLDADIVFDARCLPNPYYEESLQLLTGLDDKVIKYLSGYTDVKRMLKDIKRFIDEWLPCYIRDNRSYLTIAIGCTGGRHRSVYLAACLTKYFNVDYQVLVRHRELSS